jgi:hypothetical protein
VAKRMIVVKRASQLVGTTCRTRDFAAGLSDAAVFLISTLHVTGFHGRYLRARPVSSEGSQKPAYRIRTIRRGILITQRLPSDLVASAALRHTVVAKRVSLIRDTNLQVNVANSTMTDEDWLVKADLQYKCSLIHSALNSCAVTFDT